MLNNQFHTTEEKQVAKWQFTLTLNQKISIIPANTKEKSCVMRATWANDMDCSIMDGHTQSMQSYLHETILWSDGEEKKQQRQQQKNSQNCS